MGKISISMISGGESLEDIITSNVVIIVTDKDGLISIEEDGVRAECNGKTWNETIKDGKAIFYCSEVGNYTINAMGADGKIYETMLKCPYFSMFSTDISSGVLNVTCTDAEGTGKTCTVCSCDDNYNITTGYNLALTFGTDLVLLFPGVAKGKYLVTVDGKYTFYREITSIESISHMEVELKHWLYRNGEQCTWNTGGWLACGNQGYDTSSFYSAAGYPPVPNISRSTVFDENGITITGSIYCGAVAYYENSKCYSGRGRGYLWQGVGTRNKVKGISKFQSIYVSNSGNAPAITVRNGAANSAATYRDTATKLKSGASALDISGITADDAYIVIDDYVNVSGALGVSLSSVGAASGNCSTKINEIYMV